MSSPLALYAVFGSPISHSLSPVLHNYAFQSRKRPAFYLPVECTPDQLGQKMDAFDKLGGHGVNFTRPLKEQVLPMLAARDVWVSDAGAANTVRITANGWAGANTDCEALFRLVPFASVRGSEALVLGSGGAARASAAVLNRLGYRVAVAARRPEKCDWAHERVSWDDRLKPRGWRVVVNATPLGQLGESFLSEWPVPAPGGLAVEWVYRPRQTQFTMLARGAGSVVIDGLTLLIEQAALAWHFWFGEEGPRDAMWEAVRPWL